MVMKVEVISKEMVKPSSPTPHHLRSLKLSFLDQLAPPVYVPIILFYQNEFGYKVDRIQISQLLKKSLSNILTGFYPLAGRMDDMFCIDCNDAGAEYVEAQVHSHISDVIGNPIMEELNNLLPIQPYSSGNAVERSLLAIQISFFDGGGIAIGVCISHKVADGSSLVNFLNTWAAKTRGDDRKVIPPSFDIASHFPPRDLAGFAPTTGITKEKIVTKRFVFDKNSLAALKVRDSSSPLQVKDPTRVEALSASIWKHFMELSKSRMDTKKVFAAVHAVNLRTRMSPPLPDYAFGNLWTTALAVASTSDDRNEYHDLVLKLRNAIRKINNQFVEKVQNGDEYLKYLNKAKEEFYKGDMEWSNFSSWCRFPVYEADYGWGKPIWVSTTTLPFKNVVILMSTRSGDGIEAWINLLEEDMANLEKNPKALVVPATQSS